MSHDDFEWGPWVYRGIPAIGDYIMVDGVFKDTGEFVRKVGFVSEIDHTAMTLKLLPETYPDRVTEARRWRLRKAKDNQSETRISRLQRLFC